MAVQVRGAPGHVCKLFGGGGGSDNHKVECCVLSPEAALLYCLPAAEVIRSEHTWMSVKV